MKKLRILFLVFCFSPFSVWANDWQQSGNNIMFSGGRVGIGTMNPKFPLHIGDISINSAQTAFSGDTLGMWGIRGKDQLPYIQIRDENDLRAFYLGWGSKSSKKVYWKFENGYRLGITGGNIGIGTTTPGAQLHVLGTTKFEGTTTIVGPSTPYPNNKALLIYAKADAPTFKDQIVIAGESATGYGIAFAGQGHHRGGIYAENAGGTSSSRGNIGIWARNLGNIFLEAGKVGVGTKMPTEKFEVAGNIKLSGNILSDGDICIGNCKGIGALSAFSADESMEELTTEEPSFVPEESPEGVLLEEEISDPQDTSPESVDFGKPAEIQPSINTPTIPLEEAKTESAEKEKTPEVTDSSANAVSPAPSSSEQVVLPENTTSTSEKTESTPAVSQ